MKIRLLVFFLLGNVFLAGQTNLRILNPQRQWQNQQGVIESATISIQPKGLYAECGLYLTFSERTLSNSFTDDSLEIVLNFQLPEAAIVHDSWLWIDDEIAVARIMDRWTASQIYEEIVDRRSDPSILFKNGPTQYSLRVYPLKKGQTRRVKITYLMPMSWNHRSALLELPTAILSASRFNVSELKIVVWPGEQWEDPTLAGISGYEFTEYFDENSGQYFLQTELPYAEWIKKPRLKFGNPIPNGVYLNKWSDENEGIYQLAVLPSLLLENPAPRKVALLFDYETTGSPSFLYQDWLRNTRIFLESSLEPTDSFNLFFTQLFSSEPYSEVWLPARPEVIQQVFSSLSSTPTSYQHLPGLFASAIQFIKNNGRRGHILLESNTAQFANTLLSNELIGDLQDLIAGDTIQISAVDFRWQNWPTVAGLPGNAYLLSNLAQLTGGNYFTARNNSWNYERALELGFDNLWDKVTEIEINTSMPAGFTYGRLTPHHSPRFASPVSIPVLQVGKYSGQFPMNVTVTGLLNGYAFYRNFVVNEAQVHQADTLNAEIWYGTFVQNLERGGVANFGIPQIIQNSLSARVLSLYTAFLCLEDPTTYCDNCVDETMLTNIGEIAASDTLIRVAPNPFTDRVEIEIKGLTTDAGTTTVEVFDLSGKLVARLALEQRGDKFAAVWNGRDASGTAVAPGVYVALVQNKQFTKALRLVKSS